MTPPWTRSAQDVLESFHASSEKGLDSREVRKRLQRHGPNRLREARRESAWRILLRQFKSLIILLLAAAALLSFAFGEWVDGTAISVAILVNTLIGFFTELKAVRSMEALHQLGKATARVRRNGTLQEIPSEKVVPGDIVVFEGGEVVPADIRLLEASKLQADESALTGESMPVAKGVEPVEDGAPLGERRNMLYKGTAVTRGSGEGVVTATGMDTELGSIAALAQEAEEEITPLEKRLDRLGHRLVYVILGISLVVAVAGVASGKEWVLMVETAVALAVAAIPEGLPIVATIALARGMWRMARRNAVVNRLSAVETLGAANIVFSDKTGTLTENRMTATRFVLPAGHVTAGEKGDFLLEGEPLEPGDSGVLREVLETAVLCNNAAYEKGSGEKEPEAVGDPLEVALLAVGASAGLRRRELLEAMPEEREEAFDSETKMMATYHRVDEGLRVAVKGAPEAVLESCSGIREGEGAREMDDKERDAWRKRNDELAQEGLRTLALAMKRVDSSEASPYENLVFLGLAGLWDPPREEVRHSIETCRRAGVRVIMVTGDHVKTARSVGLALGMVEEDGGEVVQGSDLKDPDTLSREERDRLLKVPIFARVSPKQKLDLVRLHQGDGSVAAMTGDGVNDAPALKKADIGIAMGRRGTQVAREAADMVLMDDSFSTIVDAIEKGRIIFDNIRRFVVYLLSGNVSQVLMVLLALLAGAPLPILPLQILYLNMLGDVFPALALGFGEGEPGVMGRKPRDPREPVLTRVHWKAIGGYSLLISLSVLGAFALAFHWLGMEKTEAVTVSFLTLAFARLWHTFNMRSPGSGFLSNDVVRNPFVWGALGVCVVLLLLAVYVPVLASVLALAAPGPWGWTLILSSSLVPWIVGQALKGARFGF